MKASVKQIIDAYIQAVERCNKRIQEVNEIHKKETDETRAYHTRKVILKWFRTGGL